MSIPFLPSTDELNLASRLLEMNSWNRSDNLSVDTAIGIFKQSGLSFKQVREIWSIADKDGSGKLSKEELAVVIRLMGWVQAGETLDERLLKRAGPLPKIKGIPDVQVAVASIQSAAEFPLMTAEDAEALKQAFLASSPINGVLHKRKVMEIYMGFEPDLSFETLFRIMNLVEKNQFEEVEFKSFAIGLHVVRNLHIFPVSSAPVSVPPEIHNILNAIQVTYLDGYPEIDRSPMPISKHEVESSNIQLPPEVDSDVDSFIKDMKIHNSIRGDTTLKFMSTYQVYPSELVQIWRQSDFDSEHTITPERLAFVEKLVRRKLATKVLQTRISTLPPPPSYHTSPTEQDHQAVELHQTSAMGHIPYHPPPDLSGAISSSPTSDPPEYAASTQPNIKPDSVWSQHLSTAPSSTFDETFLNSFRQEVERLTSQLETVVLDQTGVQNNLHQTIELLRQENLQLKLREQSLQGELARKEVEYDEAEKLLNTMRFEVLEKDVTVKQHREAIRYIAAEAAKLEDEVDIQSKQITSLTDLMASMETTIKELHLNPAHNDLRIRFLRASARESEAATTKALSEVDELRRTVINQEQDINNLRWRLEEGKKNASTSPTHKDLDVLREDHEHLKMRMTDLQQFMERHILSSNVQSTFNNAVQNRTEDKDAGAVAAGLSRSPSLNISTDLEDVNLSRPSWLPADSHISQRNSELIKTPERGPQLELELDLSVFRSEVQRKGYMGGDIVQRFVFEYGLEANLLNEIGENAGLSRDHRTIDLAINLIREVVKNGREVDHGTHWGRPLSRSLSTSSTDSSSSTD